MKMTKTVLSAAALMSTLALASAPEAHARASSTASASGCSVHALVPTKANGRISFTYNVRCSRGDLLATSLRPTRHANLKQDKFGTDPVVGSTTPYAPGVPNDGGWYASPVYSIACRTGSFYTAVTIDYLGQSGLAESTNLNVSSC